MAIKRYPAGKPGGSGGPGGYTQVLAALPTHTESPDTAREAAKARKKSGDENSVDGVLGGAMIEVVTHMDVVAPLTWGSWRALATDPLTPLARTTASWAPEGFLQHHAS